MFIILQLSHWKIINNLNVHLNRELAKQITIHQFNEILHNYLI